MSELRVNTIVDETGNTSPNFTKGLNVTGVITATSFDGTVSNATNAAGLTGTPDITVRNITGVGMTLTGVLTYEDVTNIDSVGLITARNGLQVLAGITTIFGQSTLSNVNVTSGIATVAGQAALANVSVSAAATVTGQLNPAGGIKAEDLLKEEVNVTAGKLSDNTNINVEDGMVHLFTTAESTTSTPNIRYNGSTALNAKMSIGESIVVTLITTANGSAYSANITIDGSAVTERWIGGSAPDTGGSSGVDIHSFTIIKTADATFTVIANHSMTS